MESSDEEYNSDFYENLDDDDLLQVDEVVDNEDEASTLSANDDDESITQCSSKKRQTCVGLQSAQISSYIKRTPAQFGGSRRIEVIAHELFPKKFEGKRFTRKSLDYGEKRKLNRVLYAESVWQIDRESK